MNVLLIGCGETGSEVAQNIIQLDKISLLGLYSRTTKSSKQLSDKLKNPKTVVLENLDDLKKYDNVIIVLSGVSDSSRKDSILKRKTTYQVRQDELKYNLGAIASLIPYLKKLKESSNIIVVTNPVDEITNYLRIVLGKKNVLGFGLDLDCKRYSNSLGKSILCVGTHGKAVPIIDANSELVYDSLYKKEDSNLMAYIKRNGIPAKAGGSSFFEFFKKFISNKEELIHISYYLDKDFCGVKDISISLPYYVKNGKLLRVANIKLNEIERKRFKSSAEDLKKSVEHILSAHKELVTYK